MPTLFGYWVAARNRSKLGIVDDFRHIVYTAARSECFDICNATSNMMIAIVDAL